MDRVLRHSWFRSAGSVRNALLALIVLLGVAGYLLTSRTIRSDRDAAAARRAQSESVQIQEVLGRARAYVAGLGDVLTVEPQPKQARFARLAGGTAASVGLDDVLWVQHVTDAERPRYERRIGAPITRLTPSGRLVRAPRAASYLPATFTSTTRPELQPGVDVSSFPGLAAATRNRASVFATSATRPSSLAGEPGVYLLEATRFGRGPDSRGFLVVFVPRGWFTTTLQGDPNRIAMSQDGRVVAGKVAPSDAAASFDTLGRRWHIGVAREPPSGLQSTLPWLALAWPCAVALIVFLVGRAIMLRRRAERDVQRIFDLSADMLATIGFDGYWRRVNPSFERTLGYPREELLARPFTDFIHPGDVQPAREQLAHVIDGREAVGFEIRFLCADGSERLLQWNARAVPEEGIVYGIARDVTDRRRAEREFEAIFNLSLDLLCIAGLDGYFRRVNPAFERAFGYSSEELVSRPFLDFVHPDDRQRSHDALAELSGGQEVVRFDNRNVRADGSILWLEWSSRPVPDEGIFYGSARDVTDRKRAEAELREAQGAVEESRAALRVHAQEQEALRRVATLVARDVPPAEIFSAVAEEVRRLFGAGMAAVARFEPDGTAVVVLGQAHDADAVRVPRWRELDEPLATAAVFRTGHSARRDVEDFAGATGVAAVKLGRLGNRSTVASPIVVEGRLWGVISVSTKREPMPADTEERMANFTKLVATAIANAENRGELEASRARVVAATAEERRRVVRDLHDGAQQRLVHTVITLKLALREIRDGDGQAEALVGEALDHAEQANAALRELVHGILPAVLTSRGLRAGVEELALRSPLPVTVDVSAERLPLAIEATAYFVVSEALTNAMKHSGAQRAEVSAVVDGGEMRVEISDDGVGGADPARGSGLTGLADRVEALGGTVGITSPAGSGTSLLAKIPIAGR
ncbi:MAG TPA: PAS domain S-box protein [Baekduia sp.]|uniref:PAS domain S-box protein n=1 Tax=Baekduia sp. TaxID=2600305 RepID=UPI002D0A222F|nr:PAS domain S-box protein [Baekduia sp.]HMJ37878.1 PAS domain S-box protein [Baekduia sp.]